MTEVPVAPARAAEITQVPEEHRRSEKRQRTGETSDVGRVVSFERNQRRSSYPASAQVAATGRRCFNYDDLGHL